MEVWWAEAKEKHEQSKIFLKKKKKASINLQCDFRDDKEKGWRKSSI